MNYRFLVAPLFLFPVVVLHALDIDGEKKRMETGSNKERFSIFAGDPNRIQKANAIDFADLETKTELMPTEISLEAIKQNGGLPPTLKINYKIRNHGKRTYTLSFPTAQRYDITIKSPTGAIAYLWSNDKIFTEVVGKLILNPVDTVGYTESIPLSALYSPLTVGDYTVEIVSANYPELNARSTFKVALSVPVPATPASASPTPVVPVLPAESPVPTPTTPPETTAPPPDDPPKLPARDPDSTIP